MSMELEETNKKMNLMVSINCITFNHEKYISKSIDSFLSQVTNFEFEILIGEDCSTDNTRKIVEEYVYKFPNKIKLITSNKNVGMIKNFERVKENSKGKYIAICEGDDYWTDPYKLQKQVNFMEENPECSMCYHAAEIIDARNNNRLGFTRPYNKTFILPSEKLFIGGGHICPTASILYIRKLMIKPPNFYYESPVVDHALALVLSNQGKVGYIDQVMSVRNLWVPGSWNTEFQNEQTKNKKITHLNKMIKVLDDFNEYSVEKWRNDVNKNLYSWKVELYILRGNTKPLKNEEIKKIFKKLNKKQQLKIYSILTMPRLYKKLAILKQQIKKYLLNIEIEDSGVK